MVLLWLLAIVVGLVGKTVHDAGHLRALPDARRHGACRKLGGTPEGTAFEDLAYDGVTGTLIGAGDNRAAWYSGKRKANLQRIVVSSALVTGLYVLDRDAVAVREVPITGAYPAADFHPHGLEWVESERRLLVVVHHALQDDAVVVFRAEEADGRIVAFHFEAHVSPEGLARHWNDVAYGGAGDFFVTNYEYYDQGDWMYLVEMYTQRPWGYVAHCTIATGACTVLRDGLYLPNGIAVEGGHVRVVETLAKRVTTLDRDSGATVSSVDTLGYACDNLTGSLTACHPRLFSFLAHVDDPHGTSAPVVVLDVDKGEIVYASAGEPGVDHDMPAVAGVVEADGVLFLGGVMGDGILACLE